MTSYADPRPDWADGTRGQCATCRYWPKLTKAGLVVKHKRSEPGLWHKVPCEGGGSEPLPAAPANLCRDAEDGTIHADHDWSEWRDRPDHMEPATLPHHAVRLRSCDRCNRYEAVRLDETTGVTSGE